MIYRRLFPIYAIILLLAYSCETSSKSKNQQVIKSTNQILNPDGKTIEERFNPPESYRRLVESDGSYATYLRNLPLKSHGALVHTFDGYVKDSSNIYVAVVDRDIGNKDLQQCADIVMRLRAEYLYETGQYDKIHFNFVNGFNAEYAKWADGYRIKIHGNRTWWEKTSEPGTGFASFQKYLEWVYMYAGTASLWKELDPITSPDEIEIGDVFIKGGSPGHAVMVVDLAIHEDTSEKAFILVQSYMPAQEIQVLINPSNRKISPWYRVPELEELFYTPEWTFSTDQLMRFPE